MKYDVDDDEFEGLRCNLDGLPLPEDSHSTKIRTTIVLSMLAALFGTGIFGIIQKDYVPVLGVWGVCSPIFTLVVRRYIGPFDGWNG
jgi:hypothetical protein